MYVTNRSTAHQRGQVLVIVGVGIVVIIALVGLVIDGGYAWGQQRQVQNGTDAMSIAGATVLAENLAGTSPAKTDGDVGCAVEQAAGRNHVSNPVAFYTDINGDLLTPTVQVGGCSPGGGAIVPSGASGVKAGGDRTFDTYLARVIGFSQFTTSANATARAGVRTEICSAEAGCGILPVTFALNASTCDETNQIKIGSETWPEVAVADADATNEATIPICSTGPGSVGWLDLSQDNPQCPNNIKDVINNPCNDAIPIPTWLHTKTGNINSLDAELAQYYGSIVFIPIWTNTCNSDPGDSVPTCPGGSPGNGSNLYYYVPKWAAFLLDASYTSASNKAACNSDPGMPHIGGNGASGCFKGWFTRYVSLGEVGAAVGTGPQDPDLLGVQLIR